MISAAGRRPRHERVARAARPGTEGTTMTTDLPRRRLLGLAGAGAAGPGRGRRRRAPPSGRRRDAARRASPRPPRRPVDFYGEHQAGIVTPAQDRLHFVAFDVITDDRGEARRDAAGLVRGGAPG